MQPDEAPLNIAQLAHAWVASISFEEQMPLGAAENVEYGINFNQSSFDSEDRTMTYVRLSLKVDWLNLTEGESPPFDLSLDVAGAFAWQNEEIADDLRTSWIELNATYLLWPYARAYISMITAASSLPPLTIYTMRVPELPRALEQPATKPKPRETTAAPRTRPARAKPPTKSRQPRKR